ncbi:hypothetical protein, partial [Clostridium botulinum]|uniref:hypothetical protein n=1 Tax=Clostridium botulinum TaxID=1491 RepID=UPI0006A54DAD
ELNIFITGGNDGNSSITNGFNLLWSLISLLTRYVFYGNKIYMFQSPMELNIFITPAFYPSQTLT